MTPQVNRAVTQTKATRAMLSVGVAGPAIQSLAANEGWYIYIRSQLTYTSPAWYAQCSDSQRRHMQVQQNCVLRLCAGAGRYVRNDVIARVFAVPTMEEFVRQLASTIFSRADNGCHQHLRDLASLHARSPDAIGALPRDLLRTAAPPQGDG
ncbi:uncharacterized protein LOC128200872 [Galleria mellonella]|uniref:Uncharacterized protein LOC128200872 n=1 Tax=Galleria mellonella TaxID=7137 RepID=A0ABM3MKE8_GALME|nr:uncharacterized protein LOC128200872 [Galleria mellonella]